MTKEVWESLRDYRNAKADAGECCFTCEHRKIDKNIGGAVCAESCFAAGGKTNCYHRAYGHKVCNKWELIKRDGSLHVNVQ